MVKILYIMRGLPGSGKSTAAKKLGGFIYSTDDFFYRDGKYVFDASKIGGYHKANQSRVRGAMEQGLGPIVVDNTNTQKWEMQPYVDAAAQYGYEVEYVEPDTPWAKDVDECFKRNTHGVPRESIERMLKRWEEV